ncbi:39S ribosomal protein L13, mitochondrial-like [Mya arenaria]|uniref:39S ribosomal protein L13, mitochondrial-like n=1 Tax=Mya arenaria TaxID=6604 RepID=UPI0022E93E6C|nr:39S ribosomal protein L13, mitochondrial-like [Mya arenaria]XP_052777160.1 39S ribosomal protein L13, mitochondrial-like [Mya arenaria]
MSRNRVLQWGCMSRNWWLYDAKYQCPFRSAEKLCMYLEGRHKPLYHPLSDVGDHVVVINTQHIAMVDDMWRKHHFELDTRFAGGKSRTTSWLLHEADPTKVLYKTVFKAGPKNLLRPNMMKRLHLFPDEHVPDEIMENVSDVIRQIQVVPKTLDSFSEEEVKSFPKLFDWPKDHIMFKRRPLEDVVKEQEKLNPQKSAKKK